MAHLEDLASGLAAAFSEISDEYLHRNSKEEAVVLESRMANITQIIGGFGERGRADLVKAFTDGLDRYSHDIDKANAEERAQLKPQEHKIP